MRLTRLVVSGVRRLEAVDLRPSPRLNLVVGANGAGKTSLLEALHLLAYGRSFRCRVRDGLIRTGAEAVEVFAEWHEEASGRTRRAGLRHEGQRWSGKLDGEPVTQLGDLCAALAVITFEPGSHALITGAGEPRRRLMDWGLFHVEPNEANGGFLALWRRYARALKQRNSLLKSRARGAELDAWDHELAQAGEPLTRRRQAYLEGLEPLLQTVALELVPALGSARLVFQPGWARQTVSLADALVLARDRDLANGFTSVGPHRGDWRIDYAAHPAQEALSRGQAKLTALSILLAQAQQHATTRGDWPVMAFDDLTSELDRDHYGRVLRRLMDSGAQILMTSTERPTQIEQSGQGLELFHVEQGRLTPER